MEQPPSVSSGGIAIPETAREKAKVGTVVRCGIWRMNRRGNLIPFPVVAGQRVLINERAGRWLMGENLGWKLVDQNDVLAIFEETK